MASDPGSLSAEQRQTSDQIGLPADQQLVAKGADAGLLGAQPPGEYTPHPVGIAAPAPAAPAPAVVSAFDSTLLVPAAEGSAGAEAAAEVAPAPDLATSLQGIIGTPAAAAACSTARASSTPIDGAGSSAVQLSAPPRRIVTTSTATPAAAAINPSLGAGLLPSSTSSPTSSNAALLASLRLTEDPSPSTTLAAAAASSVAPSTSLPASSAAPEGAPGAELADVALSRYLNPYADPPWTADRLARSVFFAKVPPALPKEELARVFEAFGPLVHLQLFRAFPKCKVSRGCGIVEYVNKESAESAQQQLHGRCLWSNAHRPIVVGPVQTPEDLAAAGVSKRGKAIFYTGSSSESGQRQHAQGHAHSAPQSSSTASSSYHSHGPQQPPSAALNPAAAAAGIFQVASSRAMSVGQGPLTPIHLGPAASGGRTLGGGAASQVAHSYPGPGLTHTPRPFPAAAPSSMGMVGPSRPAVVAAAQPAAGLMLHGQPSDSSGAGQLGLGHLPQQVMAGAPAGALQAAAGAGAVPLQQPTPYVQYAPAPSWPAAGQQLVGRALLAGDQGPRAAPAAYQAPLGLPGGGNVLHSAGLPFAAAAAASQQLPVLQWQQQQALPMMHVHVPGPAVIASPQLAGVHVQGSGFADLGGAPRQQQQLQQQQYPQLLQLQVLASGQQPAYQGVEVPGAAAAVQYGLAGAPAAAAVQAGLAGAPAAAAVQAGGVGTGATPLGNFGNWQFLQQAAAQDLPAQPGPQLQQVLLQGSVPLQQPALLPSQHWLMGQQQHLQQGHPALAAPTGMYELSPAGGAGAFPMTQLVGFASPAYAGGVLQHQHQQPPAPPGLGPASGLPLPQQQQQQQQAPAAATALHEARLWLPEQ